MALNDLLKNPALQKATVTFASSYAKRMLEGKYTQLMQTQVGQRLMELSRPSKYAIEFGLNSILAYLSTKGASFEDSPVTAFLWEVGKDTPSEIMKRMLNGEHSGGTGAIDVETISVSEMEKRVALEGLLRMDVNDLATFLSWLEKATPAERQQMAERMASLTDEEQKKILRLTPGQAAAMLGIGDKPTAAPKTRPPDVQADLDATHKRLDEKLRQSADKGKS